MGKSTIDGPFSIAKVNYQRVYIYSATIHRPTSIASAGHGRAQWPHLLGLIRMGWSPDGGNWFRMTLEDDLKKMSNKIEMKCLIRQRDRKQKLRNFFNRYLMIFTNFSSRYWVISTHIQYTYFLEILCRNYTKYKGHMYSLIR